MEIKKEIKQLSKKRFITMIVLIFVSIILYLIKDNLATKYRFVLDICDGHGRNYLIYISATIIGVLHYFYIVKNNQNSQNLFVATSMGLVNSLGSSLGYALIMNKAINFAIGIAKDYLKIEPFFTHPDKVDQISLFVITLVAVYISGFYLVKMAGEFIVEIVHPTATPTGDIEKNRQ